MPKGRPARGGAAKAPAPKKPAAPGLVQKVDPPGTTYRCTCCGESYESQRNNFPISPSQLWAGWGGYFPVCKKCMKRYYDWLLYDIFHDDETAAMRRMAQLCDWYFSDDILATAMGMAGDVPYSLVNAYTMRVNAPYIRKRGLSYADTILDQQTQDKQEEEKEKASNEEAIAKAVADKEKELREYYEDQIDEIRRNGRMGLVGDAPEITMADIDPGTVRFFGVGFTPDEYFYLENQYNDWTKSYPCDSKAQEEIFKNISLAQLNVLRAQHNPDGDVTKAIKAFNDQLTMANIAPNQQKNALNDADTFGTLIERWENEKPIPKPDPEWEDVDGIRKYISTWFFGHLCKMFKVKNDWASQYEDEIAPYTAHPVVYEGDFDVVEDESEESGEPDEGSGAENTGGDPDAS